MGAHDLLNETLPNLSKLREEERYLRYLPLPLLQMTVLSYSIFNQKSLESSSDEFY